MQRRFGLMISSALLAMLLAPVGVLAQSPAVPPPPPSPPVPIADLSIDIDEMPDQLDALKDVMRDRAVEIANSVMLNFQNPPQPPNPPRPPRPVVVKGRDSEERLYSNGIRALDGGRWDEATRLFTD